MVPTKSMAEIADKYKTVTPGKAQFYKSGIESGGANWEENTLAAADTYASGVQAAIAEGRFASGVSDAGNAKHRRKSLDVGVSRYGPGVIAGAEDYAKNFAPYRDTIAALELPARGPRGDPANNRRIDTITQALHEQRIRG